MDSIGELYVRGRATGLPDPVVGNLVALRIGLAPVSRGWTLTELRRLAFVRWLDDNEPDVTSEVDRMTVDEATSMVERPPEAVLNPRTVVYACDDCEWTDARLSELGEHLLATGHAPGEPRYAPAVPA